MHPPNLQLGPHDQLARHQPTLVIHPCGNVTWRLDIDYMHSWHAQLLVQG